MTAPRKRARGKVAEATKRFSVNEYAWFLRSGLDSTSTYIRELIVRAYRLGLRHGRAKR